MPVDNSIIADCEIPGVRPTSNNYERGITSSIPTKLSLVPRIHLNSSKHHPGWKLRPKQRQTSEQQTQIQPQRSKIYVWSTKKHRSIPNADRWRIISIRARGVTLRTVDLGTLERPRRSDSNSPMSSFSSRNSIDHRKLNRIGRQMGRVCPCESVSICTQSRASNKSS